VTYSNFSHLLRRWRTGQGLSQTKLAHLANISYRHLNFLENNKSKPSKDAVLRLADALKLSEKNTHAFARSTGFDISSECNAAHNMSPSMLQVTKAILKQQNPYPALVTDHLGNIVAFNRAMVLIAAPFLADVHFDKSANALELLFDDTVKSNVNNWEDISNYFLNILLLEVVNLPPDSGAHRLLEHLETKEHIEKGKCVELESMPGTYVELTRGAKTLKYMLTYVSLGTPYETSMQQYRMQLLHPVDAETKDDLEACVMAGTIGDLTISTSRNNRASSKRDAVTA